MMKPWVTNLILLIGVSMLLSISWSLNRIETTLNVALGLEQVEPLTFVREKVVTWSPDSDVVVTDLEFDPDMQVWLDDVNRHQDEAGELIAESQHLRAINEFEREAAVFIETVDGKAKKFYTTLNGEELSCEVITTSLGHSVQCSSVGTTNAEFLAYGN
jgi:hypothetical protein